MSKIVVRVADEKLVAHQWSQFPKRGVQTYFTVNGQTAPGMLTKGKGRGESENNYTYFQLPDGRTFYVSKHITGEIVVTDEEAPKKTVAVVVPAPVEQEAVVVVKPEAPKVSKSKKSSRKSKK